MLTEELGLSITLVGNRVKIVHGRGSASLRGWLLRRTQGWV